MLLAWETLQLLSLHSELLLLASELASGLAAQPLLVPA